MSKPSAHTLAADVREALAIAWPEGDHAEPNVFTEALAALDALVAQVDTLTRERDEDRIAYVNRESVLSDEAQRWKAAHDKAAQDWREEFDRRRAAGAALADARRVLEALLAWNERKRIAAEMDRSGARRPPRCALAEDTEGAA